MKRFAFFFVLFGLMMLAACSGLIPAATSEPTLEATATTAAGATETVPPTQVPTEAASPTATASPTPEPTPDLSWIQEAPLAEVEYRLPLSIRHLTDRLAVLQFALEEDVPASLYVWRSADHGGMRQLNSDQGAGVFVVDGLEPAVDYQAAVLIEGEPARQPALFGNEWPVVEFQTMDYDDGSLTAAVFGDSGFGDQVTFDISSQIAAADVDMVLHTGDVVYKLHEDPSPPVGFKDKLYETHQAILVELPFYSVPGNHEYDVGARWQGQAYYYHAFPKVNAAGLNYPPESDGSWYSVAHGDIQFIMLNSQSIFGQPGEEAQRAWLADRIDDESFRYSVIVLHIPPYSLGRHQTGSEIVRSRWGDLLVHERVPLVLSGHDHNYQRWQVDSTTLIVSGGGSAVVYGLTGGDPDFQHGERVSHHVIVEFGQDEISLRAIDREGELIDEARINTP